MKKKTHAPSTNGRTPASFIALAENVPDVICRFDKDFYHLYVNPAIEKATGMPTSHFIGKTTGEIGMAPEFAAFWNMHITNVFQSKQQVNFEFDFPSEDGVRYFQSYVVPEFDEEGEVQTVLSISRDITAIRQSEQEKDTFIAMVTHELKTPITSVKAFAQLLGKKSKKELDKDSALYVSKMDSQLNRLNKLIGDLLDATRIGKGKMEFTVSSFSFCDLVNEVCEDLERTTNSHKFYFKKPGPVQVTADRDRVGQVLMNLLSNAVKYSPPGSVITVDILKQRDHLQCCVRDEGPGIPKEEQGKLFQRFTRLSKKKYADSPGLGLGLYISSEIVKQSGGKIWVESEVGNGTTFCFTLPLRQKATNS